MLSYLHGFHAGNFADMHKHAALWLVLEHLRKKKKPFCVIDTTTFFEVRWRRIMRNSAADGIFIEYQKR